MSTNQVINPYEYFMDFNQGRPIFNGQIFVGLVGTDPEVQENQKDVTFSDACDCPEETVIMQPIRTSSGGVPIYNGSPIRLFVEGAYSLKVNDRNGVQVYYSPDVTKGIPVSQSETSISVSNVTTLRLLSPTVAGQQYCLLGHTVPGIGGGSLFYDESDTTSADNNITIFVTSTGERLKRPLDEPVSIGMSNGDLSSLTIGLENILIDLDLSIESDLIVKTNLIEDGGVITVSDGVTLNVLSYESNGKYFLKKDTVGAFIVGLYTNDSTMSGYTSCEGQTAIKYTPGYDMGISTGGYVNDYTSPTTDIPQEHGEAFAYVKFKGALGQFRFLFKNASGSTTKTVNVYPVGSPSSFDGAKTSALFNSDDMEKEVILFSGTQLDVDGFLPKVQIAINPSNDYKVLEVDILEVKIGYMNARHTERTPSRTPLGLKTMSVREGVSSLWFNDLDDSRIKEIISNGLRYDMDSVQIVMLFKAAINEDLSINHEYFARFEGMLWWLSNRGVAVNVCTNHIFGDKSLPEIIVYDDQILTSAQRLSLKNRMSEFMKLISQHPSVQVIEVCNEANIVFDDELVVGTIATPTAFLNDMTDAVHENSNKLASVSFSGGGVKGLFSLVDFGQDIIDMHAYNGISTSTVRPMLWPIISSEHGSPTTTSSSIGIEAAEEYSETFGPWWRYVTESEAAFSQETRTANALSVAGTFLQDIQGDTSAYSSDIAAGPVAATLGVTRLQNLAASASSDPTEFLDANGTWIDGFLIP